MQQRDGWNFDAYGLSSAVSYCGSNRDFRTGSGFHCLAMKGGLISDVYVGSSLVVLYRDSDDLDNAHKVFEEMPEKNVVSWMAMISGFAQEWLRLGLRLAPMGSKVWFLGIGEEEEEEEEERSM